MSGVGPSTAAPGVAAVSPPVSPRLPRRARVVVIGGGIIGASILYHLARRGIGDAVLLERDRFGCGTTWHAAGIVGQLRESQAQTELAQYTVRLFKSLEEETGQATGYRENGSISIALTAPRQELIRRAVSAAKRLGVPAHYLTPREIKERWPLLRVDDVLGGMFVPSNGQVNPLDVTQALIKGARGRGAQAFERLPVEELMVHGGRVVGVHTTQGEIRCDRVVLAAGMWSHRFAKRYGVSVPLHAAEHFYFVTQPLKGLDRATPVLTVADERTYYKEEAGKLLVGGFEAAGKAWPKHGDIPATFSFDELPPDLDHMSPILELAFARVPALAATGVQLFFCGPESFTADGRALLGPAPDLEGLFLAAGFNSNGILSSGGVGRVMAEWITSGLAPAGIGPLHAQRAMAFQANSRYLRERVQESIGLHMTLPWPGHQFNTARGVRQFPVHDRLAAAGAVMGERVGWEIPLYYAEPGTCRPVEPSLGLQAWHACLEHECQAARDAAVLIDQSCYAKFLVSGRDALRALEYLSANRIDRPVGRSVYTQWLNERGGVEADLTVTRTGESEFLVVTGHPAQVRERAWFRAHIDRSWQVAITDVTAQHALFALSGPRSRAILEDLSEQPLPSAELPFGAAREIDLAYARAWVVRRSSLGELGFEVYPTADVARHVFDELMRAGEPYGLRLAGFLSQASCRLEKGFVNYGHDLTEDDSPLDAGLGFALALDKPGDFIGREALERHRAAPGVRRRVNLRVRQANAQRGPVLLRNEPLWRGNEIVGHVTSGGWGYRVGGSLGMGWLNCRGGFNLASLREAAFEAEVAGERHAIDVQVAPFYDPEGVRMRS